MASLSAHGNVGIIDSRSSFFATISKMADDTRQQSQSPTTTPEDLSREALNVNPENKAFTGTQWQGGKQIPYKPPENANLMAGGTQHTAGGQEPEVTIMNALKVGQPITELHKRPCVRDALLTGIGAGFAMGGGRLIFGGERVDGTKMLQVG